MSRPDEKQNVKMNEQNRPMPKTGCSSCLAMGRTICGCKAGGGGHSGGQAGNDAQQNSQEKQQPALDAKPKNMAELVKFMICKPGADLKKVQEAQANGQLKEQPEGDVYEALKPLDTIMACFNSQMKLWALAKGKTVEELHKEGYRAERNGDVLTISIPDKKISDGFLDFLMSNKMISERPMNQNTASSPYYNPFLEAMRTPAYRRQRDNSEG